MLIYHYSNQLLSSLKTKAASGTMSLADVKKERLEAEKIQGEEWAYCDHISFFMEPIPAGLLPELFGDQHLVWFKGNKLYEYVVNTADLDVKIRFRVAESAKKTALYDQFSAEKNWVSDDPKLLKEWRILEDSTAWDWGEKGTKRSDLDKQILAHQDTIVDAFIAARGREDFEENRMKYAANVPHLMLYPEGGKIPIHKINQITMGNKHRRLVVPSSAL